METNKYGKIGEAYFISTPRGRSTWFEQYFLDKTPQDRKKILSNEMDTIFVDKAEYGLFYHDSLEGL